MKILVIDDELELLENITLILELAGYKTIMAKDGVVGIDKAKEHQPDLILCDLMLPLLDGHAVLTALHQDQLTSLIPIIIMSGKSDAQVVATVMEQGASSFLKKPFNIDTLLAAISRHEITI